MSALSRYWQSFGKSAHAASSDTTHNFYQSMTILLFIQHTATLTKNHCSLKNIFIIFEHHVTVVLRQNRFLNRHFRMADRPASSNEDITRVVFVNPRFNSTDHEISHPLKVGEVARNQPTPKLAKAFIQLKQWKAGPSLETRNRVRK